MPGKRWVEIKCSVCGNTDVVPEQDTSYSMPLHTRGRLGMTACCGSGCIAYLVRKSVPAPAGVEATT